MPLSVTDGYPSHFPCAVPYKHVSSSKKHAQIGSIRSCFYVPDSTTTRSRSSTARMLPRLGTASEPCAENSRRRNAPTTPGNNAGARRHVQLLLRLCRLKCSELQGKSPSPVRRCPVEKGG